MAIRPTIVLQSRYEQKKYLWPIYDQFNITKQQSFIYDECQEIYQHQIAVLIQQPSVFNERKATFDLMCKAREIYQREKQQAEEQGEEYATINIEIKLVRSNIKGVNIVNKETEAI